MTLKCRYWLYILSGTYPNDKTNLSVIILVIILSLLFGVYYMFVHIHLVKQVMLVLLGTKIFNLRV